MDSEESGDRAQGKRESVAETLGQSLAAAAQKSGLSSVAGDETPTGTALLAAMGGIRGLIETIVPGLVFLVIYSFSKNVPIAIAASVAVAVVFTVLRLIARTPVTQAIAGLIGVGASAVLALITGRGSDFFLLGVLTNAGYALAILISMLVRWPLIGLAAGYLMGDGIAWRANRSRYRALQILTACWLALFVARLAVEVPLYLTGNLGGLAIAKLLMGLPLYAPLVLLSWLMIRSIYPPKPMQSGTDQTRRDES